jgi:hypothetical protein
MPAYPEGEEDQIGVNVVSHCLRLRGFNEELIHWIVPEQVDTMDILRTFTYKDIDQLVSTLASARIGIPAATASAAPLADTAVAQPREAKRMHLEQYQVEEEEENHEVLHQRQQQQQPQHVGCKFD